MENTLAEKFPLSILFQFCDIVQECTNKILWLTFLFPEINIFSCLSPFSYSLFHEVLSQGILKTTKLVKETSLSSQVKLYLKLKW